MAFIVEMVHGRLNKLQVNEDGKLYFGGKDDDYAYFSCAGSKWENLLSIGQQFGWNPLGSVLSNSIGTGDHIKSDYRPSSWNKEEIYKVFLREDALALSNALQTFIKNEKEKADFSDSFLHDFITFIRKGDFIFVWDD